MDKSSNYGNKEKESNDRSTQAIQIPPIVNSDCEVKS